MAPSLLLLLLLALSCSASLPPPRRTFPLNSAERPLVVFTFTDVKDTTALLLSEDQSTLYVGAQNAVLSLDVSQSDVIRLKNKVQWRPSAEEKKECEYKVKNPSVDCPNYVSILKPINATHLYACGSYAYSPQDAFIDAESLSMVKSMTSKTRCPHNPFERSTAITHDGELFTATTTDFKGQTPQISRYFSKDGRPDVNLDSPVNLLKDPTFISSSLDQSDRKLYFFFTEVGEEFRFIDELLIPRVAQVCKDDVGGERILQNKWTSFTKASLLCQSPKQLPYNLLQDMFPLQPAEGDDSSDTMFFGIFTSQWSPTLGSAVCAFRLQDIKDVFGGSYKTRNMQTMEWSQQQKKQIQGKCGLENATDSDLQEVKNSFLTSGRVGKAPAVVSSGQQYSRVAAMRTRAADGRQHTLLFLLTESGFLHKVVLAEGGARVVEEIQVFVKAQPLKSLVLSSAKGVLYVGTSEGVTAVPVARCSAYSTCSQCVLSRDPLCGWSRSRRVCTRVEDGLQDIAQDIENGDAENECQGQTRNHPNKEIFVRMNEAVSLSCQKPSNLSTLTWTSSLFKTLPDDLFIQSTDGSLRFIVTDNTTGEYRCEAEEGRYKDVVTTYHVELSPLPRSMGPSTDDDQEPIPEYEDWGILTTMKTVADPETTTTNEDFETSPTVEIEDSESSSKTTKTSSETQTPALHLTPNGDCGSFTEPLDEKREREKGEKRDAQKTYFSELVVVTLLLVICICALILGGLHVWQQRKDGKLNPLDSPDGSSKTDHSMESVPSLSSPDDEDTELKEVK